MIYLDNLNETLEKVNLSLMGAEAYNIEASLLETEFMVRWETGHPVAAYLLIQPCRTLTVSEKAYFFIDTVLPLDGLEAGALTCSYRVSISKKHVSIERKGGVCHVDSKGKYTIAHKKHRLLYDKPLMAYLNENRERLLRLYITAINLHTLNKLQNALHEARRLAVDVKALL